MPSYVLDTSAILALLKNEPERHVVQRLLEDARTSPGEVEIAIPFIVLMEVEYILRRERYTESAVNTALAGVERCRDPSGSHGGYTGKCSEAFVTDTLSG